MKSITVVAGALTLLVVSSSTLAARGGGNFVSVFDTPKAGVCFVDLHASKGDDNDAREEIDMAQAVGAKFGDFRGIRPDQVARAHYKPCGKGKGEEAPPAEEPKG